jgi:hypothetical protein
MTQEKRGDAYDYAILDPNNFIIESGQWRDGDYTPSDVYEYKIDSTGNWTKAVHRMREFIGAEHNPPYDWVTRFTYTRKIDYYK